MRIYFDHLFCVGQNTFTLTNYVMDPLLVPKMFQRGLYRVEIRVLEDEVQVSGMEVVVRLS